MAQLSTSGGGGGFASGSGGGGKLDWDAYEKIYREWWEQQQKLEQQKLEQEADPDAPVVFGGG